MNTYIFQHVEFEGPGYLQKILKDRGHDVHVVKLFAGDPIPHEDEIDFAIMLGGPMSVLDEADYPFFVREKELCRDMVQLGKPLLGICLGAQMIASAFRAAVIKAPEKEIGWFPIQWNNSCKAFEIGAETLNVFHWHGETFKIPKEATWLAASEGCKNQAFKLGSAIALQFHLEMTEESVESLLKNCGNEIKEGLAAQRKYVQSEKDIRDFSTQCIKKSQEFLKKLIDEMLRKK